MGRRVTQPRIYIETYFPDHIPIDQLLFVMFSAATILLVPVVAISDGFIVPALPLGKLEYSIMAMALVTLLDYFLITLLILWTGPIFASQAAYIVTLAGVGWGIVIFDHLPSIWIWSATFVLLLGVSLVRPKD